MATVEDWETSLHWAEREQLRREREETQRKIAAQQSAEQAGSEQAATAVREATEAQIEQQRRAAWRNYKVEKPLRNDDAFYRYCAQCRRGTGRAAEEAAHVIQSDSLATHLFGNEFGDVP